MSEKRDPNIPLQAVGLWNACAVIAPGLSSLSTARTVVSCGTMDTLVRWLSEGISTTGALGFALLGFSLNMIGLAAQVSGQPHWLLSRILYAISGPFLALALLAYVSAFKNVLPISQASAGWIIAICFAAFEIWMCRHIYEHYSAEGRISRADILARMHQGWEQRVLRMRSAPNDAEFAVIKHGLDDVFNIDLDAIEKEIGYAARKFVESAGLQESELPYRQSALDFFGRRLERLKELRDQYTKKELGITPSVAEHKPDEALANIGEGPHFTALPGLPGGDPRRPVFLMETDQDIPRYNVRVPPTPMCRVGVRSQSDFPIRIARIEIIGIHPLPPDFAPHAGLPLTLSPAYPSRPNYTELTKGGEALFNVLTYSTPTIAEQTIYKSTERDPWIELMHNVPEVPKRISVAQQKIYKFTLRAIAERPGSFIMNEATEAVLTIESNDLSAVSRFYLVML